MSYRWKRVKNRYAQLDTLNYFQQIEIGEPIQSAQNRLK